MIINVHAGHNPDGKIACGAIGHIKESTEARAVKDKVIALLKAKGHTVYDCTCNDGTSVGDVLRKIVAKCNAHDADLDVSIHFNAGTSDKNSKTTGTEVLVYSKASKSNTAAKRTVDEIAKLGFTNRGVKVRSDLYVLKHTNAPAMLVECCFVDDKDDVKLYDVNKMATAIANGIMGSASNVQTSKKGTQAVSFKNMNRDDILEKVGPLFTADQKKTGVLASVSMAQFILESACGKSELAQEANNCFGMKKNLSGNAWSGSTWDGSVYKKQTSEWDGSKYITIYADFRKYSSVEDSIADHSAYLLGAKNGSKLRYSGLKGCADHKKALQIIKSGGYATSPKYVDNLLKVISNNNLKRFDYKETSKPSSSSTSTSSNKYPKTPFLIKVLIDDLNYRSLPSMEGEVKGQTKKGIFTIVEVSGNWGKLKSGAGWVYLANKSYCTIQDIVE